MLLSRSSVKLHWQAGKYIIRLLEWVTYLALINQLWEITDTMLHDSVELFPKLLKTFSYQGKGKRHVVPLVNFTFFVGAGLSKAWDQRYPIGNELFSFTANDVLEDLVDMEVFPLGKSADVLHVGISPATLKNMVYQLNMQLKYPVLRTRYVDESTIKMVLDSLRVTVMKRFEGIMPINYFDVEAQKFPVPGELTGDQQKILDFFGHLRLHQDGSQGIAEGVRINFITTNYDYLVETILDNIIGGDDSMFLYTYRGITPSKINGTDNPIVVHSHWLVDTLIKINGGFEILGSYDTYHLDYRRRTPDEVRASPPVIMLPSKEQDYTDRYFTSVFPKAARLLQESRVLVIVGSSLPEEDALLRLLLRQFAEDVTDAADKFVFYIDRMSAEDQLANLEQCFQYSWRMNQANIALYPGGFVDWVGAVDKDLA